MTHRLGTRAGFVGATVAGVLVVAAAALAVTGQSRPADQASASGPQGQGSATGGGQTTAPGGSAGGNGSGATSNGRSFTMSGAVTGLYPGATRSVALAVQNPNEQAIRVQSVTVTVANASAQCPGSVLSAGSFTPFVVPGRGSATGSLPLHLAATVGNACRNATWTLTYSGTAVKA